MTTEIKHKHSINNEVWTKISPHGSRWLASVFTAEKIICTYHESLVSKQFRMYQQRVSRTDLISNTGFLRQQNKNLETQLMTYQNNVQIEGLDGERRHFIVPINCIGNLNSRLADHQIICFL